MRLRDTTVLVTGAAGCVGSAVVGSLADAGASVRAMVRRPPDSLDPRAEVVEADLRDARALARVADGVELAVHCAAAASEELEECRATNVEGTRNLLEALLEAGTRRMVHISTISTYDLGASTELDEESPLWTEPVTAYGYTKAEADRMVLAAGDRGLASIILRPGVVLSMHPRSAWGPLALERARRSEGEPLWPAVEIPYVHVDNLASAVLLAAERVDLTSRVYNLIEGAGPARDYLAAVRAALGTALAPVPENALAIRVDASRIRQELGWKPRDRWREFLAELARGC